MKNNTMSGEKWNWIFDWSGTLVDDMALVICATNHVMRIYDRPEWERESFRRSFQLPYVEFYKEHLPNVELDELEEHFRHGFAISEEKVPVLPHAEEFLHFLHAQKSRMFVLTSMCAQAFAEQECELKLNQYFEKTYAGVLDKREVIGEIISSNGLDPKRTIFVGDMTHDVETAHHGGIYSAGVLTGYNHREVLESVKPTILLEDLAEFKEMLSESEDWHDVIGVSK
ncbi:HAD family hydrolase [Rubritalea sp.]|uniref:HAD family hydrolase n=1 Tax=Rubritalea sp. TaxID=2109375 RepID=UPI003EF65704